MYTASISGDQIIISLTETLHALQFARNQYEKYMNLEYEKSNGYLKAFYEGELTRICKLFHYTVEEFMSMSFEDWKKDFEIRQKKKEEELNKFILDLKRGIV